MSFKEKGLTSHTSVEIEETTEIELSTSLTTPSVTRDLPMDISEIMNESGPTSTTHNVDLDTEDEDNEDIISESSKYCDVETMKYVAGTIIRRLNCMSCAEHLASLKRKDESEGFMSLMTYPKGHLHEPSDIVLSAFHRALLKLINFHTEKFFELKIIEKSVCVIQQ